MSLTLPATLAVRVRSLAKSRGLSVNRFLAILIENGVAGEGAKEQAFSALAERLRAVTTPEDVKRLGHEMDRMLVDR